MTLNSDTPTILTTSEVGRYKLPATVQSESQPLSAREHDIYTCRFRFYATMVGKNSGICHSCRGKGTSSPNAQLNDNACCVLEGQTSGESTNASPTLVTTEDLSLRFESQVRLTEEVDFKISMNVTIRRGKDSVEGIGKGKG
ncbi:Hypothetical predicted protein, partial [Olea europaea subsp. europaea]